MSQFVRKNIDIISSTSRPSSGPIPPPSPSSGSGGASSLQGAITPRNSPLVGYECGALSPLLFENYGYNNVRADPDSSLTAQSFCTALQPTTSRLAYEPTTEDSVSTVLLRSQQQQQLSNIAILPQSYESLGDIEPFGASIGTIPEVMSTSRRLIEKLKRWWRSSSPNSNPDLERQPLLPYEPATGSDNENGGVPLGNYRLWYRYLAAVVLVLLFLVMIITGDPTLLFMVMKGLLCYIVGHEAAETLFGTNFCPVIKQGKSSALI